MVLLMVVDELQQYVTNSIHSNFLLFVQYSTLDREEQHTQESEVVAMNYISSEVAGWALLILGQVYLLKYKLFRERLDKIGAALTTSMAGLLFAARLAIYLIA